MYLTTLKDQQHKNQLFVFEENEDVQSVSSNFDVSEETLNQYVA